MTWSVRSFVAIVVSILATIGCSTAVKRPMLSVAPDFASRNVLDQRTAFVMLQPLDITAAVQSFVLAFDGDHAAGVTYTESQLRGFFTGSDSFEPPSGRFDRRPRLHLIDIADLVSSASMSCLRAREDQFGTMEADVDTTALSGLLSTRNIDYLVMICNPRVAYGSSPSPVVLAEPTLEAVVRGHHQFASIDAQVMVWDSDSKGIVWNGFVRGVHSIELKFTKNTARRVAASFAQDLYFALR